MLAENVWDPFSTTQTSRMVAITQKLVNGYPSAVHAENKNTQVKMYAFSCVDDTIFSSFHVLAHPLPSQVENLADIVWF